MYIRLCALSALVVCITATSSSTDALGNSAPAAVVKQDGARSHKGHRVGGAIRSAWPKTGKAPRTRQARWLARQVGAIKPRDCARSRRKARQRCNVRAGAAALSIPLQLVRSYEIPVDDPAYHRLLNWSWTYDSAVTAAAFAATGDKANSAQVLDQLAALQFTDGSLEIAFDTVTGESAQRFRAGTVAWAGLAAATYDVASGSSRYLEFEQRTADYLLTLQMSNGLIRGGPDVSWISTQHNLIAYVFLARLASELRTAGNTAAAARRQTSASTIAAAINANLLVSDGTAAHFRQGLNDDTRAFDVQALGAMYLQGTGQPAVAAQVVAYAQSAFALTDRSVERSSGSSTYNESYQSSGPFSGYAPYAGAGAPNVRWAEASGQMRLAQAALGLDTRVLDTSIAAWAKITKGSGPLQADRTITSDDGGVEYHVWPASTAAAWTVLAESAPAFFAAPLPPATTLVTGWTKVRGGNLITTYPDGRVDMITSGGERRAIVGSTASDYTVTSNATLLSGAGYGVYVRASADAATKLTAYCIQLDRVYGTGEIVVRQILGDVELGVPIARVPVPSGFNWYGVPHVLGVTMRGNTMNVTLDGAQQLNVGDLAAASTKSVSYAYGAATVMAPPLAGGYGLRAWGDGLVTLQQMTVGLVR